MNQNTKNFEVQIKNMRISMTDEIEYLNMLYSKSSKDLINLTVEHRKLGTKFDAYF